MSEIEGISGDEEDRFPGLAELLEDVLTPQWAQARDPLDGERSMAMYIERLQLELPIEIETRQDHEGRSTLGVSPPTQWIETSVQPVLHGLRVTLELDDVDLNRDEP